MSSIHHPQQGNCGPGFHTKKKPVQELGEHFNMVADGKRNNYYWTPVLTHKQSQINLICLLENINKSKKYYISKNKCIANLHFLLSSGITRPSIFSNSNTASGN